ncbi:uncharacterized protein L201_001776 [Kwoniella dendrophila CBS 6074]|uniref:GDP/GTP exchange factor Sec2 N-terminal domain-containing protein n=1 Tax=Kwoniella dendrophila CBS 6074 TaxID=1295534 RepID=A0AAX4JNE6_9TREE
MSESNGDKVEDKQDGSLGLDTNEPSQQQAQIDIEKSETGDKGELERKTEEDNDTLVVKHAHGDLEKPSPIILPKDLLNPHEADKLHAPDSPTTTLISSLREQLTLLSDQSVLLNHKLISSISKSADLEDELNELQSTHKNLNEKAKELEKEKNKWEESMNTGLLVERSQIKDEMQKLAQGLVEEERKRGTAEEKRREVENEVDDLTAKLFDQANAMVATERMSRAEAEARLKSTEENLAAAEAAVRDMQLHLQSLPPTAAITQPGSASSLPPHTSNDISSVIPERKITRKYLSTHIPYIEFIGFISHLRNLRPIKEISKNTFQPPLISILLTQPFLARTIIEDNDPTLRLDIAPDLGFLSRRSVTQAIISGDLIIEPVSLSTFLNQSSASTSIQDLNCSLCGKTIFNQQQVIQQSPATTNNSQFGPTPIHPQRPNSSNSSTSRFSLKPFFATTSSSTNVNASPSAPSHQAASPSQSPISSPALGPGNNNISSIYIFRIAKPQVQSSSGEKSDSKLYPLCRTGWCLERMRATCELWHFVRTGIIHVVWHGDDTTNNTNRLSGSSLSITGPVQDTNTSTSSATTEIPTPTNGEEGKIQQPPPLPQRKKSSWALGFKLSDKSTGGWTRGWKSGNATNSPPVSPSGEKRRESVGSLGAEKEDNNNKPSEDVGIGAGLGLGEALNIDKVKSSIELQKEGEAGKAEAKDVPVIQEPVLDESNKQEKEEEAVIDGTESPEKESNDNDQIQPPPLSRATSNISIPLSVNTDETGFHTPKGGQNDLPSSEDENDQHNNDEDKDTQRDEQKTPHPRPPPPPPINTEVERKDNVIDLSSPSSTTASPTKSGAPPPIPRRAAARNRLSQLSQGGSGANSPIITDSPINSQPPTPDRNKAKNDNADDDDDELSILKELRDELEQRKSEDIRRNNDDELVLKGEKDNNGDETVTKVKRVEKDNETTSSSKKDDEEEELEEPFTPVNLDEKFPLSPLQQQTFPSSRPNSQSLPTAPPPLPPRNLKTPILQVSSNTDSSSSSSTSTMTNNEKRYFITSTSITENNNVITWENKTWEKIIKLKEEMWKSRIGVLDE